MKKLLFVLAVSILLAAASAVPAKADTLIYDNGPTNGNINAWTINFGYLVSDSFTVGAGGTSGLTSAQIGLWAFPGDGGLGSVQWSIGTSFFNADVANGISAATSNTFEYVNGYGYDIYQSTFNISTGALGPGTYYFTLQNATVANNDGDAIYWDENDGPSQAMSNVNKGIGSESFQIYGKTVTTQTPEPDSLLLLGSGLLGLAGGIRKRMKAQFF
jgi:hypothetical protein